MPQHSWRSEDNIGSQSLPSTLFETKSLLPFLTENVINWPTSFHGFPFLHLPYCHSRTAIANMIYCAWLYMVCGDLNWGSHDYTTHTLSLPLPSHIPRQKVQNLIADNTCCQLFPWTWEAHLVHSKRTHVQITKVYQQPFWVTIDVSWIERPV